MTVVPGESIVGSLPEVGIFGCINEELSVINVEFGFVQPEEVLGSQFFKGDYHNSSVVHFLDLLPDSGRIPINNVESFNLRHHKIR